MTAYAVVLERASPQKTTTEIGAGRTRPGTVNALIVSYYKFVLPRLAESTRATWRGVLERFRKDYGDDLVTNFERKHIVAILTPGLKPPASRPRTRLRKILRLLFDHAIEINLRSDNPVIGIKRFKVESDGHHTWTVEEVAPYRAYWPLGSVPRLCMELAFELATRHAEIVTRGPQHERPPIPMAPHGKLLVKRLKGSKDTLVPISAELRAAINACAPYPHLTYLATKNGKARSYKSLTGDFRKWCDAAGLPKHCRLHGLKKKRADCTRPRRRLGQGDAVDQRSPQPRGTPAIEKIDQEQLAEEVMARRAKGRTAGRARRTKRVKDLPPTLTQLCPPF